MNEVYVDGLGRHPSIAFPVSSLVVTIRVGERDRIHLSCGGSELDIVDLNIRLEQRPSVAQQLGLRSYVAGFNWSIRSTEWDLVAPAPVGLRATMKGYPVTTSFIDLPVEIRPESPGAALFVSNERVLTATAGLRFREQARLSEGAALIASALMLNGVFFMAALFTSMPARLLGRGPEAALEGVPALEDLFTAQARVRRKRSRFTTID